MKIFKLPKTARKFAESCGFDIEFQEVQVRGQSTISYRVSVVEEGSEGYAITDVYEFQSWEHMKQTYPTLLSFLTELSTNQYWTADWRDNDRIFYIRTVEGHQGLYDLKSTVWLDAYGSK